MKSPKESTRSTNFLPHLLVVLVGTTAVVGVVGFVLPLTSPITYADPAAPSTAAAPTIPPLDKATYDQELLALAHIATTSPWYTAFMEGTTTITLPDSTTTITVAKQPWPVETSYPEDSRALLPSHRIVAYYGNFYSTGMGVLGQYPESQVLSMLASTTAAWEAADPTTPVTPAIEYIAVTAQGSAGADGMYRARMPDSQIDLALQYAKQVNGIVILDVQDGLSTVQDEIPPLEKYLAMPQVNLALDPEFSMKDGTPPGDEIGTMDASDINYVINYLSQLVIKNNLPPKILIVHRFTEDMVTNYQNIQPTPQVQVVMDMDGWGFPDKKVNTYEAVIEPEPVQFTGVKLFYKNDLLPPSTAMLTPQQVLDLDPSPIYVQYQ